MSITKRTRANGTTVWDVVEYTGFTLDGKRDRVSMTCSSEKQAKIEQAKLIAQRDAMRNKSGRMNFSTYVESWFWPRKRSLAPSTQDGYRRDLKLRLLPAFGNMDVRDIDRMRIQKMVDACATEKVARNAIATLKTILNEAMGDGLILRNPACAKYALPPKGARVPNPTVVTTFASMRPYFDAIDEYGDETVEKLAVTGFLLGLRPEERYGLDWQDFDLHRHTVSVHQAYTYATPESGGTSVKETKTAKSSRIIPLPDSAVRRIIRMQGGAIHVGPFIEGVHSNRMPPSSARRCWDRFMAWCDREGKGIARVSLENMRHSFATSYLHAGGNVEDLSRILGHSDINTTYRRYVRPDVDDLRKGMNAVSAG